MASGVGDGLDVGVVVVTHRAREHLARCIAPLLASPLKPRVLVVNSGGDDGTVELAHEMGAETLIVAREQFNHGLTREFARRHLGTEITVFMTPDAYPADDAFLERLVGPIVRGEAEIAYGRQLPRADADILEEQGRAFNYRRSSHVRSEADRARFGSYTHFCSNACAAWWTPALDQIGGFKAGLVSEETVATAEILRRGGRIAYVAEATVEHSHRQGPMALFKRQFDIGYARSLAKPLLLERERDEVRGTRFARIVIGKARRERPLQVPGLVVRLAAMWLGYRAGLVGPKLPHPWARVLSGQEYYWNATATAAIAVTAPVEVEPTATAAA